MIFVIEDIRRWLRIGCISGPGRLDAIDWSRKSLDVSGADVGIHISSRMWSLSEWKRASGRQIRGDV